MVQNRTGFLRSAFSENKLSPIVLSYPQGIYESYLATQIHWCGKKSGKYFSANFFKLLFCLYFLSIVSNPHQLA